MNGNEPAFPCEAVDVTRGIIRHLGLTKRELFAAMAMQQLAGFTPSKDLAELALAHADALLAALAAPKANP